MYNSAYCTTMTTIQYVTSTGRNVEAIDSKWIAILSVLISTTNILLAENTWTNTSGEIDQQLTK